MDVNEKIINTFLNSKNYFTIVNIPFKVKGPKGGVNYSNIDILAVDNKNNFYDFEIKWRSVFSIGATDKETVESLINQLTRKERKEKIKELIGDKKYKKILVTTRIMFGKRKDKQEKFIKRFNDKGIDIWFFDDIIPELVKNIKILGRYDEEILQIIRIIKQFKIDF